MKPINNIYTLSLPNALNEYVMFINITTGFPFTQKLHEDKYNVKDCSGGQLTSYVRNYIIRKTYTCCETTVKQPSYSSAFLTTVSTP